MLTTILASALLIYDATAQESVNVDILTDKLVYTTEDFFVSYTLDIANFYDGGLNLSSPQFQYMGQQLAPSVLRIGGSAADKTYYFTNMQTGQCQDVPSGYSCFTKTDLEMLMDYVSATKVKLVFGLSTGYPLYPDKNTKQWNSTNAQVFLNYIVDNGYCGNFYGFELGNEINKDVQVSFQIDAFKQLRAILQKIWKGTMPQLLGPDPHSYTLRSTGSDWTYVENFIAEACDGVVDGFTYHCYVDINSTDLLTYDGINEQYKESKRFGDAVKKYCANGTQKVYAGEIAEHNNGGTNGLTNKYEDTLWYLDALGAVALLGQDGFFRQQIWGMAYHPDYALLNTEQYTPLPDYWIALLFNNLMGTNVLNATSSEPNLRVYAHCFNNNGMNDGSVVLAFVSIKSNSYAIKYDDSILGKNHMDYLMTSKDNQLDTADILLNGEALTLTNDGKIPSLNGKASTNNPITIEKYSVGFIHFSDSKVSVCQ